MLDDFHVRPYTEFARDRRPRYSKTLNHNNACNCGLGSQSFTSSEPAIRYLERSSMGTHRPGWQKCRIQDPVLLLKCDPS